MTPIITELNRTVSRAITGILAIGMVWAALAVFAEPHYRAVDKINQENVKW